MINIKHIKQIETAPLKHFSIRGFRTEERGKYKIQYSVGLSTYVGIIDMNFDEHFVFITYSIILHILRQSYALESVKFYSYISITIYCEHERIFFTEILHALLKDNRLLT